MKSLCANKREEFILVKFRDFYKRKGISIKYAALYMHKENGLVERRWRTIVTIKDSLLIDNELLPKFWAEAIDTANYLRNRLPTKTQIGDIILEKAWTGERQDV